MRTARRSWGGAAILALAIALAIALALTVSGTALARGHAGRGHAVVHVKGRVAARNAHAHSFVVTTRRHHRRTRVTVHASQVPAVGHRVAVSGRQLSDGTVEASSVDDRDDQQADTPDQQGDTQGQQSGDDRGGTAEQGSGADQADTPDQQGDDDQGEAAQNEQGGDSSGDTADQAESGADDGGSGGGD
jgi:hypothetical protein